MYMYICVYIYTYRESYTNKSLIKGNPLYRDIPKKKPLVKRSFVKGPFINGNSLIREIHYKGQSITYMRNHSYMEIPYEGKSVNKGNPVIRETLSTCTDAGRPRIYPR